MKDILLDKMFEMPRWEALIEKAELKGIDKCELRKMCQPQVRLSIYNAIKNEEMEFMPPHMAQIPKETPGEFRTVFEMYVYQCMACDEDLYEFETHEGEYHTTEELDKLCCDTRDLLLLDV